MKPVECDTYFVSTAGTDGLMFLAPTIIIHSAESATMRFQMFMG